MSTTPTTASTATSAARTTPSAADAGAGAHAGLLRQAPGLKRRSFKRFVAAAPVLRALAAIVLVASAAAQAADYAGPLFDAHLHYNEEAWDGSAGPASAGRRAGADAAQRRDRRSSPTRGPTTARGAGGGAARRARPASRWCPSCGCTATAPTTTTGSATRPSTRWCRRELARGTASGPYRGIGEFHLYDSANANGPVASKLMALAERERAGGAGARGRRGDRPADGQRAVERPDAAADLGPHRHRRRAGGAGATQLLARYPLLMGELSYRPGLTCEGGTLCPEWRALLLAVPGPLPGRLRHLGQPALGSYDEHHAAATASGSATCRATWRSASPGATPPRCSDCSSGRAPAGGPAARDAAIPPHCFRSGKTVVRFPRVFT